MFYVSNVKHSESTEWKAYRLCIADKSENTLFSNELISFERHRACSYQSGVPHFEITSDEILIATLPPKALTNRETVAARISIASPAGPNIFAELVERSRTAAVWRSLVENLDFATPRAYVPIDIIESGPLWRGR